MNNLLKLEFRKQFRQKKLYVCIAVAIALLLIMALTNNVFSEMSEELGAEVVIQGADFVLGSFDDVSFILIVGVFTVLTVCEDYELRTVKNIYARGYSRKSVHFSKVVTVITGAVIMYLAFVAAAMAMCGIFFNFNGFSDPLFYTVLLAKLVVIIANAMLSVLIAFLFCKNGISIAATIFAPMIIELLLGLAEIVFKFEKISLSDYWVSTAGYSLTSCNVETEVIVRSVVVSVVYIVALFFVGRMASERTEV